MAISTSCGDIHFGCMHTPTRKTTRKVVCNKAKSFSIVRRWCKLSSSTIARTMIMDDHVQVSMIRARVRVMVG
jgi:hypothetical protein